MAEETEKLRDTVIRLLDSIQRGDIEAYKQLVDENVTCFEPETCGHLVAGIDFHLFVTLSHAPPHRFHLELRDPVFRVHGDSGYAAYTLVVLRSDEGGFSSRAINETRFFVKERGTWKMVHFHRSPVGG